MYILGSFVLDELELDGHMICMRFETKSTRQSHTSIMGKAKNANGEPRRSLCNDNILRSSAILFLSRARAKERTV